MFNLAIRAFSACARGTWIRKKARLTKTQRTLGRGACRDFLQTRCWPGPARMDVVRRLADCTMVRPACGRSRKKAVSAALNRLTREKTPDTRVSLQRSNKAKFRKLKKLP